MPNVSSVVPFLLWVVSWFQSLRPWAEEAVEGAGREERRAAMVRALYGLERGQLVLLEDEIKGKLNPTHLFK